MPPRCGIQPECHVCACLMRVLTRAHLCQCVCMHACGMFLTCWLLSQSICPAESQGPTREPHVGGAIPHPTEQAPPRPEGH